MKRCRESCKKREEQTGKELSLDSCNFLRQGWTASGSTPLSRTYCYSLVTILRYIRRDRPRSVPFRLAFAWRQSVKEGRDGRWWGLNEAPVKSRRNVAAPFCIEIARLPSFNEPTALYVGWLRCNSEYLRWMQREMKFTLRRIIPGWSRRSLQTITIIQHDIRRFFHRPITKDENTFLLFFFFWFFVKLSKIFDSSSFNYPRRTNIFFSKLEHARAFSRKQKTRLSRNIKKIQSVGEAFVLVQLLITFD